MSKAKAIFHKCIQDSQDFGSDDEHMVSRVFFSLEVAGKRFDNLYVDIKQTVGSSYETGAIEVTFPRGAYSGPFNHDAFQSAVERYYRSHVGATGSVIRISGTATNIRMRNNTFIKEETVEFDIPSAGGSW